MSLGIVHIFVDKSMLHVKSKGIDVVGVTSHVALKDLVHMKGYEPEKHSLKSTTQHS
jgi:hypothetical protein